MFYVFFNRTGLFMNNWIQAIQFEISVILLILLDLSPRTTLPKVATYIQLITDPDTDPTPKKCIRKYES